MALVLPALSACDAATPTPLAPGRSDASPVSPVCEAACTPDLSCCTERFVHGNGASIGWLQRGAPMFEVEDPSDPAAVLDRLKHWVAERPSRAGLAAAMPDTGPLGELVVGDVPPRNHRALVLHRFAQTYRGLPVVGAGEHVTLTLKPGYGALSVSGALIDARDTFAGFAGPIAPDVAVQAGAALFGVRGEDDEIDGKSPFTFAASRLVALAEVRAVAWELAVFEDGAERGTLLLRADTGGMLAYSPHAHGGPVNAQPIEIRARTFDSDFFSPLDPGKQFVADITEAPVTGGPLLGSTYTPLVCDVDPDALPECGQTRLGNEEIIVLDAQLQPFHIDGTTHPRIAASPDGNFLATPPATPDEDSPDRQDAALQDYFYRLQAVYSLIHTFHAGHWDPSRKAASEFPAQLYKPRVLLATNMDVEQTCGFSQPGCTTIYHPQKFDPLTNTQVYDEHPEADLPGHVWKDGLITEALGFLAMEVDGFKSPDLVFHEFGHIVDWFTVINFIGRGVVGSGCPMNEQEESQPCVAACVPDTSDEAPPLAETIADMIGAFAIARLYTSIDYARCEATGSITGSAGPVHHPMCIDAPEDIRSFADQRPTEPGHFEKDGVVFPTGSCSTQPGYHQSAIMQAWWEWIHGRTCEAAAPYACTEFAGEDAAAASGIEALLFAMSQTNSTYYAKLFTEMEVYIACTDGPERALTFREVFCHHGVVPCDGKPPACPAACGDDVAELAEDCDGADLRGQTCHDHGFAGGELKCSAACTYDTSLCNNDPPVEPSPTDPTGGSMTPTTDETSSAPAPDSATTGAMHSEPSCGCATGKLDTGGLFALGLLLLARRRRFDVGRDRQ